MEGFQMDIVLGSVAAVVALMLVGVIAIDATAVLTPQK
jgi:hypothetical protein